MIVLSYRPSDAFLPRIHDRRRFPQKPDPQPNGLSLICRQGGKVTLMAGASAQTAAMIREAVICHPKSRVNG